VAVTPEPELLMVCHAVFLRVFTGSTFRSMQHFLKIDFAALRSGALVGSVPSSLAIRTGFTVAFRIGVNFPGAGQAYLRNASLGPPDMPGSRPSSRRRWSIIGWCIGSSSNDWFGRMRFVTIADRRNCDSLPHAPQPPPHEHFRCRLA
jgi:hypothetical protein